MDDADLKRVAEAATPGPWFIDERRLTICARDEESGEVVAVELDYGIDRFEDREFIALANPSTVLSILSRLSAAEARVGVLEEALRDARVFVQDCLDMGHDRASIGNLMSARDVIAQALTQEPTP